MENVINFDLLKEYDGTLKEVLKVWQKQKSYSIDDTVQYKGNYLKCTTAGTSGTTTLNFTGLDIGDTITDGTVVWEIIEPPSGGVDLPEWQPNTSYTAGKYLVYEGTVYKVVNDFTSGATFSDTDLDAYIAPIMQGATSSTDGEAGMVPKSTTTDVNKFLKGDGTWGNAGGGISDYTSGTSYSSGDLVIKDNVLYKANTTTSTTWVDSEWDIIGTTFNTTSTYAQKIVTNVVAPYEMLLQVGDSNYCKPPIDVLKKTGGSDNVTLTLEDYNNPSAYTGTSGFLKIENSKAKLYNYKEYPITPQTLSTIDIGVSDEIDFNEFVSDIDIDSNTLALLHFDVDAVTDVYNNTWSLSGSGGIVDTYYKFGSHSLNANGSTYLYTEDIDLDTFVNNDFTIDFWYYSITNNNNASLFQVDNADVSGLLLNSSSASSWVFACKYDGAWVQSGYLTPIFNAWTHIAVVRNNTTLTVYQNGTNVIQYNNVGTINTVGTKILIGADSLIRCYVGNIDEFRISNIARWTEDFTPPTQPYARLNYNISSLEVN